jgi:hypothetical protein
LDREIDLTAEIAAMQREIEGSSARRAEDDRAFFLDIAGAGTQYHLIRGRHYVMVSILGFGEGAGVSEAARQLAQTAMQKLYPSAP